MQLLLTNLPRRARAAGLLLRLPASQPEQATTRSAAADRVGGEEAAWVPRSALRPPVARMVASRALGELCRLLRADLPPSKPCLVAPAAHVGGRGVIGVK